MGRGDGKEGDCHTSSPTNPAEPHVIIIVQVAELRTDVRVTAVRVAAAGLSEHGLTAHTAEIVRQRRERVVHAVRDAFGQGAAIIIKILMRLIDQFVGRSVTVHDGGQSRRGVGLEAADGVVVRSGEEDHLSSCAVVTDGVDGLLDADGPGGHVEVVWLVHQAEDNVVLRGVFLGELGPEIAELVVRRSALTDDAAVPAGVIMHVEDAEGAGCETSLHDSVVSAEEV